jgi:Cdc6-like AAA superfamily ATPase
LPEITPTDRLRRHALIHGAFTPSAPVSRTDLFSGRLQQIDRVIGALFSPGQHAVIYGERGVGKTSLANILYDLAVEAGKTNLVPARVNCSQGITFGEIWRSLFRQLPVTRDGDTFHLDDRITGDPNSEEIRELFDYLDEPSVVIIDEFDRVDQETASRMADTIKTFSDRATETTLVLVGVADSIDQLIQEHESVLRALVQIQMPRMSRDELLEIIDKGLGRCEMSVAGAVRQRIANLSQGLPHYTHLLAKHSAINAVNELRNDIFIEDLDKAIKEAVENQSQTMATLYQRATHSPRKNIFPEVLLACALATDAFGYFSAVDVRDPLRTITGKPYDIQAYIRHLNEFCKEPRGPVLEKKGERRRFQYKFVNPLAEPYVVMKGLADGLIREDQLATFLPDVESNPSRRLIR